MSYGFMGISRRFFKKKKSNAQHARNRLCTVRLGSGVESLESRIALASDCLGSLQGTVFIDNNANGVFDTGEQVTGAEVRVYRDNGDNSFNAASDILETTLTTDANGRYEANTLIDGNYFVVQSAGTYDGNVLSQMVSTLRTVDGDGVDGLVIDDFETATGPVSDEHPAGTPVDDVFTAASALGGQRDLATEILAGNSGDHTEIRTDTGRLILNPDFFAVGRYSVTWDGDDAAGAGVNPTGLGGVDLTAINGTTGLGKGIRISELSFDQDGATVLVRVHSAAGQFSEATMTNVPSGQVNTLYFPFEAGQTNAFVAVSGGGADFTNVGAIELVVTASNAAMDGSANLMSVAGLQPVISDFLNAAPVPGIDVEKLTNGNQADASTDDDVPVINVRTTNTVTWTYSVTNTGQLALNNIQLLDDQIGTIGTASITNRSINADNILDIGETWTYSVTGTAQEGAYGNVATATGTTDAGAAVTDNDSSHYLGIRPSIDIEKTTNGAQADLATDADVPRIPTGSTVTWIYTVTNNGSDPLTSVQVIDSDIGTIGTITNMSINGDTILDAGEVWTYTAVGVAIAGNYENSATVTGLGSDQTQVTDTDLSHYVGLQSAIDIEKTTNSEDADIIGTGPQVFVGSTVTFQYTVTNTGGLPLSNVVVTDDGGTTDSTNDDFQPSFVEGDTDGDGVLDLDEAWIYEATRLATLGSYQNIGRVTANDESGTTVDDADPSNHSAIAAPETPSKRRFIASAF